MAAIALQLVYKRKLLNMGIIINVGLHQIIK